MNKQMPSKRQISDQILLSLPSKKKESAVKMNLWTLPRCSFLCIWIFSSLSVLLFSTEVIGDNLGELNKRYFWHEIVFNFNSNLMVRNRSVLMVYYIPFDDVKNV